MRSRASAGWGRLGYRCVMLDMEIILQTPSTNKPRRTGVDGPTRAGLPAAEARGGAGT